MNTNIFTVIILLKVFVFCTSGVAQIYRTEDDKGIIYLVNTPSAKKEPVVEVEEPVKLPNLSSHIQPPVQLDAALKAVQTAISSKEYSKAVTLLEPLAEQVELTPAAVEETSDDDFQEQAQTTSFDQLAKLEDAFTTMESAIQAKEYDKAMALLEPLAEQGHPRALNELGVIHDQGLGVTRNSKEAIKWYEKSANKGYAKAQFRMGVLYVNGEGVNKNNSKAAMWFEKAANNGQQRAQYNLAIMYIQGKGVSQDARKAFAWIDKSTREGYPFYFDFKPGWKTGYYENSSDKNSLQFIQLDDDINSWNEQLTIDTLPPLWGGLLPADAFEKIKNNRKDNCSKLNKWKVLNKDERSLLYELQTASCVDKPGQHEITRILFRKDNTLILRYIMKTHRINTAQRAEWIQRLSEAR